MAKAIFISTDDIKRFSVLSGNIDEDKIMQWIQIAQDTHIQNYLGYDLYERLKTGVIDEDLNANETNLMNNYIKDMTIHWALVVAMGFLPYTISNKGVFKDTSENGETIDKAELESLIQKHRNNAEFYTKNYIDYMCYNKALFPEYDSNTNEETKPIQDTNFNTWFF